MSDKSYTQPAKAFLESFQTSAAPVTDVSRRCSSTDTPNLKTFLVEDSPVIRSNLIAALEDLAPVEVVGFSDNADEACARIDELGAGGCDLAIVDIFLTRGTGLDVLKCMAAAAAPVRRVVLTNYATPEIRAECLALGASRVFDKSRDIEALVNYCNEIAGA